MTIYLGVDGGGSKTFALAADARGQVLGFGQGGRANHQSVGLTSALREVELACRQALGTLSAAFASFCLSGADLPSDFALLRPALQALDVATLFDLRNDTWAALRAGSSRPWGVVVICGSGINAAIRSVDGREFVLPSLGAISGDWGGGGDMARVALGAVARAWDGRGPATTLTELVLQHFAFADYSTLLQALYTEALPSQRIYEVAPLVFAAALSGDAVAQELIIRTGTEIGHVAGSLLRRMEMHQEANDVVTGGSLFKGAGPLLIDAATLALHRIAPLAHFTRSHFEPVVGALLLAMELHGQPVDDALLARLRATLPTQLINKL